VTIQSGVLFNGDAVGVMAIAVVIPLVQEYKDQKAGHIPFFDNIVDR
jgi:hypothetical protein